MRKGVNPEKYKEEKLQEFLHRIIVPVYIPNLDEPYYKNQLPVFKLFLKNLFSTINPLTTAVTLIDNACCPEIKSVILSYKIYIDKLIHNKENKGKVFPVLQEARSVAEPFLTITDADVLFHEGWEFAVFKIFSGYLRAGVVAPLPSPALAFYENTSVFIDNYFFGNMFYQKSVADFDAELYLQGMGNDSLLNRENRKHSWRERQYSIKNPSAIVGAGHFVATYRSELFKGEENYPRIKFKNGLERKFIDSLSDKKGYYRLSTLKTFAYHMGNNIDEHSLSIESTRASQVTIKHIQECLNSKHSNLPYSLRIFIFKLMKRLLRL